MARARVKICGLTRKEDVQLAIDLGAWALGFIFYPPSPRYVEPEAVGRILRELRAEGYRIPKTVGVFVNSEAEVMRAALKKSGVDTIQMHGDEEAATLSAFKDWPIIKAFRFKEREQFKGLAAFENHTEAFLFDAAVPGAYGGTGHQADWDLLFSEIKGPKPFLLSGGLKVENIRAALERFASHPSFYALDLSSGVEQGPGVKDPQKLKSLFNEVGASHAITT